MDDFDNDVVEVIVKFLVSPTEDILTIYYDEDVLVASLTFPEVEVDDIMYFLKEENEDGTVKRLTPGTFSTSLVFGTLDAPVEGGILRVMECLFAPMFVNTVSWPDRILFQL